jgi:hypothetical protein
MTLFCRHSCLKNTSRLIFNNANCTGQFEHMQKILFILLLYLCSQNCPAQDYDSLVDKATRAYGSKNYDSCSYYFDRAFKIKLTGSDLYNAAICNLYSGNREKSFELLFASIKAGANISKLRIDPDLESMHNDRKWKKLMRRAKRIQSDSFKKTAYPRYAAQLAALWESDQYWRFRLGQAYENNDTITANKIWPQLRKTDSVDLSKFEKIVEKTGWPTKSKVGGLGAQTAYLIADHSPRETMEKYLPLLEEAVKAGEASKANYATMKDRVLVNRRKKQIYGTQKYWDEKSGKFKYFPIEDEQKVNALRREAGLPPLPEFNQ